MYSLKGVVLITDVCKVINKKCEKQEKKNKKLNFLKFSHKIVDIST